MYQMKLYVLKTSSAIFAGKDSDGVIRVVPKPYNYKQFYHNTQYQHLADRLLQQTFSPVRTQPHPALRRYLLPDIANIVHSYYVCLDDFNNDVDGDDDYIFLSVELKAPSIGESVNNLPIMGNSKFNHNPTLIRIWLDQVLTLFQSTYKAPTTRDFHPFRIETLYPKLALLPFLMNEQGITTCPVTLSRRQLALSDWCRASTMKSMPTDHVYGESKWDQDTMPLCAEQDHVVERLTSVLRGSKIILPISVKCGNVNLTPLPSTAIEQERMVLNISEIIEHPVLGVVQVTNNNKALPPSSIMSDTAVLMSTTGSGKTVTATETIKRLGTTLESFDTSCSPIHNRRRGTLIIAPRGTLNEWERTLKTRNLNVMNVCTMVEWERCVKDVNQSLSDSVLNTYLVEFQSLDPAENRKLSTILRSSVFDLVVVDEAHRVQIRGIGTDRWRGPTFFGRTRIDQAISRTLVQV